MRRDQGGFFNFILLSCLSLLRLYLNVVGMSKNEMLALDH